MSSFYTVLFGHYYEAIMPIPPLFISRFSIVTPKTVKLFSSSSGRSWMVDIEQVNERFYFTRGWNTYLKENALGLGNIVVFKFDGDSTFQAKIYETTYLRRKTSMSVPSFFKIINNEQYTTQLRMPFLFTSTYSSLVPKTATLVRAYSSDRLWKVDIEEEEEKDGRKSYYRNGWNTFVKDNSVDVAYLIVFKFVGDSTFRVKIFGRSHCEQELEQITALDRPLKRKREIDPIDVRYVTMKAIDHRDSNQETDAPQKEVQSRIQEIEAPQKEVESHVQETDASQKEVESHVQETDAPQKEVESHVQKTDVSQKEVESHVQEIDAPQKEVQSQIQEIEAPQKEVESHVQETDAPQKEVESHVQETDTPQKEVESHVQETDTPQKEVESHVQETDTPQKEVESHVQETDAPQKKVESHVPIEKTESNMDESTDGSDSDSHQKNPSFKILMQPAYAEKGVMCFPTEFFHKHMKNKKQEVEIETAKGVWTVSLLPHMKRTRTFARLSKGWSEFAKANRFKTGETLIFKLTRKGDRPKFVMDRE